jgi:hypothetical protein
MIQAIIFDSIRSDPNLLTVFCEMIRLARDNGCVCGLAQSGTRDYPTKAVGDGKLQ